MIIPEEFLERARTSWKVPPLSAVLLTDTTLRKRRNNIVKIQSYIRRYLIKKEFKRISQSAILIQCFIRGYLSRKYIKHYIDFKNYIKQEKEIIKEEQELKDLIKKYEEEVNKENQEKFNKIFLQYLIAPQKTPWHPEKDLLDTLNPKPTTPVNPSPNNQKPPSSVNSERNDTDLKIIGGTLGIVAATKIGAIGVGLALAPFTGGVSLTLSYAF